MIAVLNAVNAGPWPGDTAPDTDGFRDATEIIVAMRRRLAAETRSTDDARRYRAACRAVERIARGRDVPRIAVEAERLSAVLGWTDTVYTPVDLAAVLPLWTGSAAAAPELREFLIAVDANSSGLVISIQPSPGDLEVVELPEAAPPQKPHRTHPRPDVADAIDVLYATAPLPFAGDARRAGMATALRRKISAAVRHDHPVPIGATATHDVITEVLRELQHPSVPPHAIRFVHVDSSEGATFPIGLGNTRRPPAGRCVRLGLMSIRHMDIDSAAAGYWFRNRLVSVSDRTMADTEDFCYRQTLSRLPELTELGVTRLEIVHTGYEPASIGFYRAVGDYVHKVPLTVAPYYYRDERYVPGAEWLAQP
jgi:hypothetical protein